MLVAEDEDVLLWPCGLAVLAAALVARLDVPHDVDEVVAHGDELDAGAREGGREGRVVGDGDQGRVEADAGAAREGRRRVGGRSEPLGPRGDRGDAVLHEGPVGRELLRGLLRAVGSRSRGGGVSEVAHRAG